jgi:K+-sensing histidine kinase KdpD
VPPRPAPRAKPTPTLRSRAAGPLGWGLALLAPAALLAAGLFARVVLGLEVQRLLLLLVVAVVGVLFGGGPGVLAAVVATALGWFHVDLLRWVFDPAVDLLPLAAFAATALVVALAAGARRHAPAQVRELARHLARAERDADDAREQAARLEHEAAVLRERIARADRDVESARAAADRADRARRALIDALPPEQRAPHVTAPAPLQLFPPIFTKPPER